MTDALVFLGMTLLAAFVAQLPLLAENKDLLTVFAPRAVITFFSFILSVAVLQLSWRLAGGAAAFKSTFILTCYVSGFALLLFLVFALAAEGSFRLLDPTGYRQLQRQELESYTGVGFLTWAWLLGLGATVSSAWVFVAWGAYRQINAVSRAKSGLALALANGIGPVALAITVLMAGVLQPMKDHDAAGALPPELVGRWVGKVESEASSATADFNFTPAGFSYVKFMRTVENNCQVGRSFGGWGRARIDGKWLRLTPQKRMQTYQDCTGKHSEEPRAAEEESFVYHLEPQPTGGWSLSLEGRTATMRLLPAAPLP
jgi:hypothetical protein